MLSVALAINNVDKLFRLHLLCTDVYEVNMRMRAILTQLMISTSENFNCFFTVWQAANSLETP